MRATTHLPDIATALTTQQSTAQLIDTGAYGAALARLLPDLRRGERDPQLLDQAITCYSQLGAGDMALELMEDFVARWPELISGWTRLATLAAHTGDTARAIHALNQGFRRGPKTAAALALLNRLSPISRHSASARRLKALAAREGDPAPQRALAMHTLGAINDRAGRYRLAFRWFAAANRCAGGVYSPRDITALVAGQILRFDPARVTAGPPDMPRCVFVTGMPRSGTTLTERILQRHPQVQSLGESPALSRTVMAMRRHVAERRRDATAWDWFETLSEAEIDQFRQFFLSFLPPGARAGGQVLVSKMPLDCLEMGAAQRLLPGARFLFMDRHPLDVGLSNFCTQFHAGHGFSVRLDWTGHMIRSVLRSAADYEVKLGAAFRRQSYRALVEHPEDQIAALLAHAGLEWDPACLAPEQADASTLTASAQQVRVGISRAGLGRWRNYRDFLDPLVDALGGAEQIAAWEARDRCASLTAAA